MIRVSATVLILLVIAGGRSIAQVNHQNQLDASQTLFTVLAAINAAGYDADLDSPSNNPLRMQVRNALAARPLESVAELKKFFQAHKQEEWNSELNQYISFGLAVGGPPDFQFRYPPQEIPPDAGKLDGLNALLAAFYKEAKIEQAWNLAQPAFEKVLEQYHGPVSQALLESNGYLRNATSGYLGRQFQVYVDLLAAPNQVQTRSYKDDYFVVVTPAEEPRIDEIRHAYLHYLLDPLGLKYSEELVKKKSLVDYAVGAPALDDSYKQDFILLATECVIKAVESRLAHGADARQRMVDQAVREGFVLTAAFAEGLVVYEKQQASLRLYFPDLVNGIDLNREVKRLDQVVFASHRETRTVRHAPRAAPEPSPVEKKLAEAEDFYKSRDLEKSRLAYARVLELNAPQTLHAEAYYGLARIAALQKEPETAEKLFLKTLDLAPGPETKAWAHIYLGRLADARSRAHGEAGDTGVAAEERELARQNYRAAIAVDGASDAARGAARKGLGEPAPAGK